MDEASCPISKHKPSDSKPTGYPLPHDVPPASGSLPPHDTPPARGCPISHDVPPSSGSLSPHDTRPASGCPISHNENNMMPDYSKIDDPNCSFSKKRETSSIPMVSDDAQKWTYPSPQMFYSAMKRKGLQVEGEMTQDLMNEIVRAHNTTNEATWLEVLKWEALHRNECPSPKLRRFLGRSEDTTPRARLRSLLGYQLPFDRHDWYVDRCGVDVRYVIDYYDCDNETVLDVRPGLDSFSAYWDRIKVCCYRWYSAWAG